MYDNLPEELPVFCHKVAKWCSWNQAGCGNNPCSSQQINSSLHTRHTAQARCTADKWLWWQQWLWNLGKDETNFRPLCHLLFPMSNWDYALHSSAVKWGPHCLLSVIPLCRTISLYQQIFIKNKFSFPHLSFNNILCQFALQEIGLHFPVFLIFSYRCLDY